MPRRSSERVIWVGLAAIAAIGVAGAVTFGRVEVLSASAGGVHHSEGVRFGLQHILLILQDAESATRGFVITRDEDLLEPYTHVRAELDTHFAALKDLVADNPRQLAAARELERLAKSRLEPLDRAIGQVRAGTWQFPATPAAAGEGKRRMDAVRAQIAAMLSEEDSLLARRSAIASHDRVMALASTVSMSGVAAGLVLLLVLLDRRATYKIRRSREWLATILRSIGDGVIATDASGIVRFLNPVAASLTGWSQTEAPGRRLDEVFHIVHESDRAPAENPVAQVLRQGIVVGLAKHTLLIRRDRAEFPIEDSGAPIRGEDGGISGVVIVFKDASEARRAQLALQSSEERLRLAIEGADLGALDHDLVSGQAVWNDRLYAITGYAPGTPVTSEMTDLRTAPEDSQQFEHLLRHANEHHAPFHLEHRILRANDGALRWVSSHGNFLYDSQGKGTRFIAIVRDVTENRRLEQQVRQSQKLDALGTLAGGIAHDFNNILAVLRGNLSVIRTEIPAEHPIMPVIVDMSDACNRGAALVRQILAFGSRQNHDRQVTQLENVVAEALKLLRATLPAEVEIRTRYSEGLPSVFVDPNQIHQIIANLGINAAHAIGRRTGLIDVQLDALQVDTQMSATSPELKLGHYVRLRFSDNGSGIPREIMDRIFEPFFTTKSAGSGTGLGLSVVRGILKNHDAAISVYSEPDRGTRFQVYFPAVEQKSRDAPAVADPPRQGHGERILYIDDEESLVILARKMLERMGYRVTGFTAASEALAAFEAAPQDFDLVLTDLSMPGMGGMDVSRRVLAVRPDIPVLLATGYVRSEDVEMARSIGIREVIWKPQTISEMGDILAQQLARYGR